MSARSINRRKARREKTENRWPVNENTDRGRIPTGVEFVASLDYSSTVAEALAGVPRKAPTV